MPTLASACTRTLFPLLGTRSPPNLANAIKGAFLISGLAEDVVTGSAVKKQLRRVSNPADLQSRLLLLSLRFRLHVPPHQRPRPVGSRRQRMPVVDL